MSDRYDAVAVRKYTDRDGNEKTAFTTIGVAWPMKDRDGYSLRLHCLPAPVDGEYSILLFPPKPREDDRPAPARQTGASAGGRRPSHPPAFQSGGMDDDIPFAPEFR
jgi:hypothetical protein